MKNVIKSAVLLCPQDTIWLEHFPFELSMKDDIGKMEKGGEDLQASQNDYSLDAVAKEHIKSVLRFRNWNKTKTSRILGISRPRLDRYIEKFKLEKD